MRHFADRTPLDFLICSLFSVLFDSSLGYNNSVWKGLSISWIFWFLTDVWLIDFLCIDVMKGQCWMTSFFCWLIIIRILVHSCGCPHTFLSLFSHFFILEKVLARLCLKCHELKLILKWWFRAWWTLSFLYWWISSDILTLIPLVSARLLSLGGG